MPQLNVPSHLSQLSLLGKPVEAKLEFESFLKLLELAAAKLYPGQPVAAGLERLVCQRLLRLLSRVDYEPRVALRLVEKDQRLAQEAAAEQGARLPVNEAARQLLTEAVASGRGGRDLAVVADLLFEWAQVKR